MAKIIAVLIYIVLCNGCLSQDSNTTDLPEERGLVIATLDIVPLHAKIRNVPIYPGYESFNGSIPGIKITSSGRTHVLSIDVEFRSKQFYMYDFHLAYNVLERIPRRTFLTPFEIHIKNPVNELLAVNSAIRKQKLFRAILVGGGYHKDLNASLLTLAYLHVGVSKGTIQLAVDWLSHTIYWTDSLFRWIVAVPGEAEKLGKDYYNVIVDDHLDFPDGLTLDPFMGYLFWSDNGRHPKIERSDLKGKKRHTIISKHMVSPLSIDADITGKRIYWIDAYAHSVLSATYDGKDIKMVASEPSAILFDIAIYRDAVYVSDIRNDNLYTFNKTTGRRMSTVLTITNETIYGVAVYGERNQPVGDTDYCGVKKCEQLCISEEKDATCLCSVGYEKKANDNSACQESNAAFDKAVVIANSTHICLLDIRSFARTYAEVCRFTVIEQMTSVSSTPSTPTVSERDKIKMFDLDIQNRMIFFASVDNKIYRRPIDLPIENAAKPFVLQAAGVISGMAYDTNYSTNLYWSESSTGNIWLVDVNTQSTDRLTKDKIFNLVKPRNVIILPTVRRLAWVAGNQGNESIQTMTLDGKDLRTVVTGLLDIISLVYDNEARLFYFISNGTLHQLALNGSELRTAPLEDRTAYLLLHYNNYLAWIYNDPRYGNVWKSKDYGTATTGAHAILGNTSLFVDMKVLDIKPKLTEAASPCAYLNGGCEQICIPKYTNDVMAKVCDCSLGFTLDETDKVSCRSDVALFNFILASDWTHNSLLQIHLPTDKINSIVNKENALYMGVYFDADTKRIIWSEYLMSMIYSSELDGSDQRVIADIGNSYPYRMDKDLTTGNLYYITTFHRNPHIGVLTPSGANIWLKKNFTEEESLGDIVVHPGKGWMFYIVVQNISYVARANMDGTDEKKIIVRNNLTVPDGLAIDFTRDHLYWSDAAYDTIQRCKLDGTECVTIVNRTGTLNPEEIRDLVTDGIYLYYSAYRKDHVVRVTLANPSETTAVGQSPGIGKLDTLALYISPNRNIQPVSQSCKARQGLGDCSSICFPTETGRTCACEGDVPLKQDGKICSNLDQCPDVFQKNVTTVTGVEEIDIVIDSKCFRLENEKCEYRCPDFFAAVKDANSATALLTCTNNVTWDRQRDTLCKEIICLKSSLTNANLTGTCRQRPGSMCMYKCNEGYTNTTDMVLCNENLNWSPVEYCSATVSVTQSHTSGLPVAGVTVGIVLLVLVIIALVVVVVFLLRRRRARRQSTPPNYANAEFHKGQDGSIAIENPGYIPSNMSTVDSKDEHPYSTVDPNEIQPETGGHESLPEVAHIEITGDKAVLTYDSWLKEREKDGSLNN